MPVSSDKTGDPCDSAVEFTIIMVRNCRHQSTLGNKRLTHPKVNYRDGKDGVRGGAWFNVFRYRPSAGWPHWASCRMGVDGNRGYPLRLWMQGLAFLLVSSERRGMVS